MSKHLKRRSQKHNFILFMLIICVFVGVLIAIFALPRGNDQGSSKPQKPVSEQKEEPPIVKESTFTVSATGDILMHSPLLRSGSTGGGYDFSPMFKYFNEYVEKADLAVANLETTLASSDRGYSYSGYPCFNCPDAIVDALKGAGFDMLLTANNHSYDTRGTGLHRTVEVVREKGLFNLGSKATEEEADYRIVNKNGISLGLLCYTYENNESIDVKAPNGITMNSKDAPFLKTFDYANLESFYQEISQNLALMKNEGADASILFIHWGEEYDIKENTVQNEMAQRLCDLGIDVIIGGHPHVVQPVELLESSVDANHKTVCLYSMGNAVSNQRRQRMNLNTGHTEDGVLFGVRFARYSDGTVILEGVELLPTWVHMFTSSSGNKNYRILPLEEGENWQERFDLSDSNFNHAKDSYERTMKIVGEGMAEVETWVKDNINHTEKKLGIIEETVANEKEAS